MWSSYEESRYLQYSLAPPLATFMTGGQSFISGLSFLSCTMRGLNQVIPETIPDLAL